MSHLRPLYTPAFGQGADSGYLILRDGTTAGIRPCVPADLPVLQRFVERLSPQSRRHRFFSEGAPSAPTLARLCDSSNPRTALTLLVFRTRHDSPEVIAAGSYTAKDEETAEVALAVDDRFHGKGLGTLLLERLALTAVRHGFTRLWAVTHAENAAMREVFRESGFAMHEAVAGGDMEVELSLHATEDTVARSEVRERVATTASLRPFFRPRSVAVIGASREPSSIGYRLLQAIRENGFTGPVYAVNPRATVVQGLPAYRSVADIEGGVDLAVIAVPRDAVMEVVDACANTGVRALVVITAGFAEVDEEGRRLQARLVQKVRQAGMRMIGPNCFGLLNTDPAVRLNATFSLLCPPPGRVAMSSQSGALGIAILSAARRLNLGISTFVSVGNKADVSGNDLLQYWEEDPSTEVILLYLESFGNPRRFARIARRVAYRKPIVAVKAGRTPAGRRAAGSHTAALAASDVAVDALFHQCGVLRAETLDDMFALAALLSHQPLPRGRRVGILTNAGGPGILCADACEASGLSVPELSDATRARLAGFLPRAAALKNPVDLIASATADHYRQAIDTVLSADEIDALIVLYISVNVTDTSSIAGGIAEGLRAARGRSKDKPVLLCWMAEGDYDRRIVVDGETIPTSGLPETPARALGKAAAYAVWRTRPPGVVMDFDDLDVAAARAVCRAARARGAGWLTVEETRRVLAAFRLPIGPGGVAHSPDEAVALARGMGFPVAVKLASQRIVHKTEVGGVRLGLQDEPAVRRAFESIRDGLSSRGELDAMEGVLVQPMVPGGVEVMIGMTHDPSFGPLVAFGLGGIHVEILGDVRFRITPLTDRDAADMVREIRGYRLLEGYRGHPPADVPALEETLLRVSRLVEEIHEIAELDLNPIFALPPGQGCRIVDARIRLDRGG
ncbi:bifunctional acetate--CoA ligase family protein/GNAT family N-acetyltransferase [Candidatus Nitrospira bockiana]